MNELIDLRSDTVTRPTPVMRKAMAEAEVGDDVLGDDPTVIDLQERAAALLGKEAGLFVPSGSMGNQVCLGALAPPGSEVLCHEEAHFLHFEGGAAAAHLGLMMRPLRGEHGVISHQDVGPALRVGSEHTPRTALVAIENTHNSAGGRIFPLEEARAVAEVCREKGVPVHLDGARLFNAQAATGIPAREWADCVDTLSFCFSKGLGAPIGSMVCSTREVVAKAHRLRKRLGGGMRQAGVIAAAARVALESGIERLAEDHANARRLAEGLADLNPECVDPAEVETNMVYVDLRPFAKSATEVRDAALEQGVLTLAFPGSTSVRLVTHRDVSPEDTERALEIFKRVL
ncbi:MAG TPA: low specificity L-threonine aldolase [Actinomycetota bacterium]|nr:low specificity L-threonine aldolase [Actinomycetota bacterium]